MPLVFTCYFYVLQSKIDQIKMIVNWVFKKNKNKNINTLNSALNICSIQFSNDLVEWCSSFYDSKDIAKHIKVQRTNK